MWVSGPLVSTLLLLAVGAAQAASSWSFDDATISVSSKKGGDGLKEKCALHRLHSEHGGSGCRLLTASCNRLSPTKPLSSVISLGSNDVAKIILTAKDNGKAKRPHQAFLLLKEEETGLEAPFPLTVKETGKGVVQFVRLLSCPNIANSEHFFLYNLLPK